MTVPHFRVLGIRFARNVRDDGLIEEFHHYVMARILIIMAILFSFNKYLYGDVWLPPVRCWVPAQYDRKYQRMYIQHLCWMSGMYNIPFDEEIPVNVDDRYTKERSIIYYQWICVIFALQAVMFKFPNVVWNTLKSTTGMNLKKLHQMAIELQLVSEDHRGRKLLDLKDHLTRWISFRAIKTDSSCTSRFSTRRWVGSTLARHALLVKALNLINVLWQFQFLTLLLGFNFWKYGLQVMEHLKKGEMFEDLKHFPKTALCDFEIRQLQNLHRYTVQCSLEFNLYMEKIFVAQWFVFLMIAVWTLFDLMDAVKRFILDRHRGFINKYAGLLEIKKKSKEKQRFKGFVRHYLMDDGVFIFKILSSCSDVIATDLLRMTWIQYCKERYECDGIDG